MLRTFVLGLVLVGCTSQARTPAQIFPARCTASACATGPTVSHASELAGLVNATSSWTLYGPYTTGCLPASDDIVVTGSITVQASDLALPADCQQGCRQRVMFRLDDAPPGVTCLLPEPWFDFTLCSAITLADTTVRLRMVEEDIHPSQFGNYAPIVDVLPACDTGCGSSEFACAETHTCWASARDQCAYCYGGTNEQCACWNGDALEPDGTACSMFVSGDVIAEGTCQAGSCVAGS